MKLFTRSIISAGLVVAAGAANAQVPVPGYGPRLLPPQEVYTVLRDNGLSPLGIPMRRGHVYTISVVDRRGDDGRLVIDARNGRILRFLPANRMGDNFDAASASIDGPPGLPPGDVRAVPHPQRAAPKVASRTAVPIPKPAPRASEPQPLAAQPVTEPAQQSAAAPAKPAEARTVGQAAAAPAAAAPAVPAAAAPAVEAKPALEILPTQDMPKAQGLE